jgi:hypothetical protein
VQDLYQELLELQQQVRVLVVVVLVDTEMPVR